MHHIPRNLVSAGHPMVAPDCFVSVDGDEVLSGGGQDHSRLSACGNAVRPDRTRLFVRADVQPGLFENRGKNKITIRMKT